MSESDTYSDTNSEEENICDSIKDLKVHVSTLMIKKSSIGNYYGLNYKKLKRVTRG